MSSLMIFHLEEAAMRNRFIVTASLLLAAVLSVAAIPSRPYPQRLVNDMADIFSFDEETRLERALVAFDDSTSNQITVVTVMDLEGYDPADYATGIGLEWKVGSADFNNGIVMLIKPKTSDSAGQVFISVGYGLEGAIPDAYVKRIIDNDMIPEFRQGDYFRGAAKACVTLMQLASGEISEPRDRDDDDGALAAIITFMIIIILIAVVVGGKGGKGGGGGGRYHRQDDAIDVIGTILTYGTLMGRSGGRSHGGFGGGSFGGGSFGGGGFGGFGGGSFGGGGAGGSW